MRRMRCRPRRKASRCSLVLRYLPNAEPGQDSANNPKRPHKTRDLQGQKSVLAMTPPRRLFFLITRKEIARSARFAFYGMAGECAAAKVRATVGTDPRPIRLTRIPGLYFLRQQDCMGFRAVCSRRRINPPFSPRAGFSRGERG